MDVSQDVWNDAFEDERLDWSEDLEFASDRALVVELNRVDLVEDRDLKCYHMNIGRSGALGLGRHWRSVCG